MNTNAINKPNRYFVALKHTIKLAMVFITLCSTAAIAENLPTFNKISYLSEEPVIDGVVGPNEWRSLSWIPMPHLMAGKPASADDFSGRFKLAWREEGLYLLAEITDDKLVDQFSDPLKRYWDDDALEIFVDADGSGGDHKTNYNAFAYHIALDNQNVDIDDQGAPRLYNDHLVSQWRRTGDVVYWEVFIKIFPDQFNHRKIDNQPMQLSESQKMGFMLAYCDNDGSKEREHFYGSTFIPGDNKNQGWLTASVFTPIVLVGTNH